MKIDCYKVGKMFLLLMTLAGFVAAFENSLFAQSSRAMTPVDRRIEQANRQSEQYERDNMNRELSGKDRKAADAKRSQIIKTQIKEDFAALQTAYNEILVSLQASGAVDRDFVLETTADIKKYAVRLRENLEFPAPEKDAAEETKEDLNLDDRRKSLRTLCRHIYNFVTNPIFNKPTGLDVDQAAKAGREMDKIIELSEKIRETAEKSSN